MEQLTARWSRTFAGRPGALSVGDRWIVQCVAQFAHGELVESALVCLGYDGQVRWTRREIRAHEALGPDRLLALATDGGALVLDPDGRVLARWAGGRVRSARVHGSSAVVADASGFHVTDEALRPVWSVTEAIDDRAVLVGNAFYWVDRDAVHRHPRDGAREVFARMPLDAIVDASRAFERREGHPCAFGSWEVRDGAIVTVIPLAGGPIVRDLNPCWLLAHNERSGGLLLDNVSLGHVVASFGEGGELRWCTMLSDACCGGLPCPTTRGRYVASNGCAGSLTWIDDAGQVVQGAGGNAGWYSGHVQAARDGLCLIDADELWAFDEDGRPRWRVPLQCRRSHYEPSRGVVASALAERVGPDETVVALFPTSHARG